MAETYPGKCYCGTVMIEVTGMPEEMDYCHCEACRSYLGAPINAFTLVRPCHLLADERPPFLHEVRRYCED